MSLKRQQQKSKHQNKQTEFPHLVLAVTSNVGPGEMGRACCPSDKQGSAWLVASTGVFKALLFLCFWFIELLQKSPPCLDRSCPSCAKEREE